MSQRLDSSLLQPSMAWGPCNRHLTLAALTVDDEGLRSGLPGLPHLQVQALHALSKSMSPQVIQKLYSSDIL